MRNIASKLDKRDREGEREQREKINYINNDVHINCNISRKKRNEMRKEQQLFNLNKWFNCFEFFIYFIVQFQSASKMSK